jgi:hypothetical protein
MVSVLYFVSRILACIVETVSVTMVCWMEQLSIV